MAFQQIYTSVPSGLVAGRSGFCTAARHRELSEGLASRIENISSVYDRGSQAGESSGRRLPVIYSHRIVDVRGDQAHLLMRIAGAGSDYTGRTSHIAHTFVLTPSEVASLKITPAEAILHLLRQGLWQKRYEGAAKYFGPAEIVDFAKVSPIVDLPAETWASLTGEAANAAHLQSSHATTGAALVPPEGADEETLLRLFAESACVAAPGRENGSCLWQRSFTSRLQESEKRSDFDWYGCAHNSPAHMQAVKSNLFVVEAARGMAVPRGRLAEIAKGKKLADTGSTLQSATLVPTSGNAGGAGSGGSPATPAQAKITATAPYEFKGPPSQSVPLEFGGRPHKREKKEWLVPVVGCIGALILAVLVGILAFNFLGGREIRKLEKAIAAKISAGNWAGAESILDDQKRGNPQAFENESERFQALRATAIRELEKAITAKISAGDWAGAESILHDVGRSNARAFENESERFQALRATVVLAKNYREIIANPEQVIGRAEAKGPTEFLRKVEKEAQIDESDSALAKLRKEASERVGRYEALTEGLAKCLKMHKAGKPLLDSLASLSENALELSLTEEGPFRRRLAAVSAISDASDGFKGIRDKKYTDKQQVEKARLAKEQLSTSLGKIKLPKEGPWKGRLTDLTSSIRNYNIPDPSDNEADETDQTDSGESKVLIPKTYLRAVRPDHVYGFGDIEELSGGFPKWYLLSPFYTFSLPEIEYEILGDKNVLYATIGEAVLPMLGLDPKVRQLTGKGKFGASFGNGFLLAFGGNGTERPEFQIAYQNPSTSPSDAIAPGSPYFLTMPLTDMIEKSGEGSVAGLAPEVLAVLSNIHFADSSPHFHVVVSGEEEAPPREFSFAKPEEAEIDPTANLTQEVIRVKEEVDRLETLRDADTKFEQSPLPLLGSFLFCSELGDEYEYTGLKVDTVGKGDKKKFKVVPDKSNSIKDSKLEQSLEDYQRIYRDSIIGHPFISYVNKHLFEHLRVRSESGDKWRDFGAEIRASSLDADVRNRNDPDYLKNSVENWNNISKLSIKHEWAQKMDYGTFPTKKEADKKIKQVGKAYSNDRAFSNFFASWNEVFTPAHFRTLEAYLSGAPFDPAALENAEKNLASLSESLSEASDTPLQEMGTFHIVVTTKGGGKEETFRLIKSSLAED